jgi:hypothetical protein
MNWINHHKRLLLPLLLVVLASCSSATSSTPKHPQVVLTPTLLAPTPTPSQTVGPVPTPSRSEIAPLPTNCPLTTLPGTKIFPQGWGGYLQNTTLIGRSPVWGRLPPDLQVQVSPGTVDDPWTGTKILWENILDSTQPVNVRVKNLATGVLAWWGPGDGQPPSDPVLGMGAGSEGNGGDYHGSPVSGWYEWGSVLYLLTAGCYSMDVSWPGGAWHVVFAAGR